MGLDIRSVLRAVFGAHGQVVFGIILTLLAVSLWLWFTFVATPNVGTVFHISMLFGVAATYAIVATGLGYRATERVENMVVDTVEQMDVDVDVEK